LWYLPSSFGDRDGVALVITLIMLAIITFMAVTFLVLSQRERSSVTGATDQKIARDASDSAFARVCSELLTHMMLHTNFQDYGLQVSTNYINYDGFQPSISSPTNVNYDYIINGGALNNAGQVDQNIANLLYNPRPPVFVVTNAITGQTDFRFYLDLNRNGRFDTNGIWPEISANPARPYFNGTNVDLTEPLSYVGTGPIGSNNFVGDPEWIGELEHPDQMHSPDNKFISRYAYLVVPVGQTLDVNMMHNQAVTESVAPGNDGYMRNQGVGPWEENLAAFLTDLNTNAWPGPVYPGYNPVLPYNYERPLGNPVGPANTGMSFQDALSILSYRYNGNYNNLNSASQLFTNSAAALAADGIDEYSDGGLMNSTTQMDETARPDLVGKPWAGADNPNHFFSQQDIFSAMPPAFVAKLSNLGTSNDSYNEYTFYRMLSQLGTDSQPSRGKININYKNTDNSGNVIPGMETNLIPWTPLDFFTNAAAAMFRQLDLHDFNGNLVTVTNIPIYQDPNIYYSGTNFNRNYYTPAVHRILQLAANMYDATTTRYMGNGPTNYPTVFRPVFTSLNHQVWISGYTEVPTGVTPLSFQFWDLPQAAANPGSLLGINIYGVPWVIGVKKGFPNFNEFSMENPLALSRKLEFTNQLGQARAPWLTNQVLDFAITNTFGLEAWNSYTNAYARPLQLICSNTISIVVSNENGFPLLNVDNLTFGNSLNLSSGWPGWSQSQRTLQSAGGDNSFIIPLLVTNDFTNGIYRSVSPQFTQLNPPLWSAAFVPHLFMSLRIRMQFILIDTTANRVIDFVNIDSVQPSVDIASELQGVPIENSGLPTEEWDTNVIHGNVPVGIMNQIALSEFPTLPGNDWTEPDAFTRGQQAQVFRNRLNNNLHDTNYFEAPYTPHATIHQRISWQANDPLVHYMAPDLTSTNGQQAQWNTIDVQEGIRAPKPSLPNIGMVNFAYQPWGGFHIRGGSDQGGNKLVYDTRVKDAGLQQSDDWDFPTNKLPNVGWMGRIHRGTPWQTIDMKPSQISMNDWVGWDNDNILITNGAPGGNGTLVDVPFTHPTMDYGLFDLFTTAVNENAAAGALNVNQTNLADWSAVFSGVNVLSNAPTGPLPMIIPPAGVYDPNNPTPVALFVQAINATRANTNSANGTRLIFQNGMFQHAGDVLATPQLSVNSPFINTNLLTTPAAGGVNDEIMERIPQQIMSLLTLNQNPRFVIYSFGQTLHPADHSLVMGGSFNGLCTNYQITAESATRAVVRVEGTADPKFASKPDALGRTYPPHIVVEQFNVLGPD